MTGAPGIFDTRIAYVAESGAGTRESSAIAIMDSDGTNHRYLTTGDTIVLTPRLSPKATRIAYVSYVGGQPQVRVIDVEFRQRTAARCRRTRSPSRRAFRPTARRSSFR